MNSTLLFRLSFCFLLLLSSTLSAQLIDLGEPLSWKGKTMVAKDPQVIRMKSFDLQQVIAEDVINDQYKMKPWRFGYNFEVNLNPNNSGEWINLTNGDRIWLLSIESKGAKSINVIFDTFHLPDGAHLQMYNRDRSHLVGAYTSILNNDAHVLGTELVQGDYITVEYFEPATVKGQGRLNIGTVTHGYRSLSLLADRIRKSLNDSGACNIDVLCPLGVGWEDQIRSVGLIIVNGNEGCSGALINNTGIDGRPFFLTADHCLGNPANWVFRFNWHSTTPSCASNTPSGDGPFFQSTFTSTLRANSEGSDFALVELNNDIPSEWGVYFAGWDRTDIAPDFSVGIHHPSGDIKKICKDEDAPVKAVDGSAQVWRVNDWEHGVTEPGSSGSPLFDPAGRIIGQLFGGLAACISQNNTQNNGEHDVYGRLGISWNGAGPATRLRDWLDPTNTGLMVIDGYDPALSNFEIDVTLLSTGHPAVPSCESEVILNPGIRNLGSTTITSMQIEVYAGSDLILEFDWTGSLPTGEIASITLPGIELPFGANNLTMEVLSPNGSQDENPSNNTRDFEIDIVENGTEAVFTLITDCWGSEIAWGIVDATGNMIIEGGSYVDIPGGETIEQEVCLGEGCYTFVIIDSFGDGLNGSQYNDCDVDGNYFLTDANGNVLFEMLAANGAFGDEAIHNFCVENQALNPSFEVSDQTICVGQSVQFEDTSEGEPISWLWTFPGGTPMMSDNPNPTVVYNTSGTYAVTLEISDGQNTETITFDNYITVSERPVITLAQTADFSCNDNCTGELTALVSGGTAPYTYNWSNGGTTDIISSLCYAPSFFVIVTDTAGCVSDKAIEIEQEDAIVLELDITGNCSEENACAELSIDGGEGPYMIIWSSGQTDTLQVCDLSPGEYSVSVEDNAGCSSTLEFNISASVPIVVSTVLTNETCREACDGIIINTVSGAGPFTFEWSNEAMSASEDNLCPGEYGFTVTDVNGCTWDTVFVILAGTALDINFMAGSIPCNEESTCASVNPSGGTAPYMVTWSNGQTGNEACGLEEGVYVVTITDANGCRRVREFRIENAGEIRIESTVQRETCREDCDGSIVLHAAGTFTYLWSLNNSTEAQLTNLCPGQYTVTVTDENGCTLVRTFTIASGSPKPVASFTVSSSIVNINEDPTVIFTNESDEAIRYEWSFGDGSGSNDENPSHTYADTGVFVVILYAIHEGCITTDTIEIIVTNMLSAHSIHLDSAISLFPNPAKEMINIRSSGTIQMKEIEIIHINGRKIRSYVQLPSNDFTVQLEGLATGIYFVKIHTMDGIAVKKLIIH